MSNPPDQSPSILDQMIGSHQGSQDTSPTQSSPTTPSKTSQESPGSLTPLEEFAETGLELPISVVRQYVAAGIRLVVHLARLKGGVRRVMRISEIVDMPNVVVSFYLPRAVFE